MTPVSVDSLAEIFPAATPERLDTFTPWLNAAMDFFEIDTPDRQAAFLAQVGVESEQLKHLVENMYYTTPERVWSVFVSKYDLDRDRVPDASEIEFARRFVRNPEALGNYVYANRLGNGDEASGDGFRYRARGLIGVTFKSNYLELSKRLFADDHLVKSPERLEEPRYAALSAAFFFSSHGCNEMADAGDFRAITKRITGSFMGHNKRSELWVTAKTILV